MRSQLIIAICSSWQDGSRGSVFVFFCLFSGGARRTTCLSTHLATQLFTHSSVRMPSKRARCKCDPFPSDSVPSRSDGAAPDKINKINKIYKITTRTVPQLYRHIRITIHMNAGEDMEKTGDLSSACYLCRSVMDQRWTTAEHSRGRKRAVCQPSFHHRPFFALLCLCVLRV